MFDMLTQIASGWWDYGCACAGLGNHTLILLVQDTPICLNQKDANGNILIRDTGRLRDTLIHQLIDKVLDDGMIGRIETIV